MANQKINDEELDDYEAEEESEELKRTAIAISGKSRDMLEELRTVYILKSWNDAIVFLFENMKKVPRPKSKYFD